jgi:hypothetical protein
MLADQLWHIEQFCNSGHDTHCHARFYKENRMHLICGVGSELHTHDRQ